MLDTDVALSRIGSPRVLNSFMLGSMSSLSQSPLTRANIRKSLQKHLGSDTVNLAAFDEGANALQEN
jgi:Pyruvate/2-oxoacid:ferredoxin oxidoreductase gamma subunit